MTGDGGTILLKRNSNALRWIAFGLRLEQLTELLEDV